MNQPVDTVPKPKNYPIASPEQINTLVIHCSSPEFRKAFALFIQEQLGLDNYALISIPGGVHDLLSTGRALGKIVLVEQALFLIKEKKIKKVVIIAHQGCGWYDKWSSRFKGNIDEQTKSHLLAAVGKFIKEKINIDFELYYAADNGDGTTTFFRVNSE